MNDTFEKKIHDILENNKIDKFKELFNNGVITIDTCIQKDNIISLAVMYIHENFEIFKYLIDNGADYNITDKVGNSILHWLCYFGYYDPIKYIIDNKYYSDINAKNRSGVIPLMDYLIGNNKDLNVVKYLVDNGADYMIENKNKNSIVIARNHKLDDIENYLTSLLVARIRCENIKNFLENE